MIAKIGRNGGPNVRDRTHRQRYSLVNEGLQQLRVEFCSNAMIDAFGAEQFDRLANIVGGPFLSGMSHDMFAELTNFPEHINEPGRRKISLGRIETEPKKLREIQARLVERRQRAVFGEVPQEAKDQPSADAVAAGSLREPLEYALHDCRKWNSALGMCLRIEEQFNVDNIVPRSTLKISEC